MGEKEGFSAVAWSGIPILVGSKAEGSSADMERRSCLERETAQGKDRRRMMDLSPSCCSHSPSSGQVVTPREMMLRFPIGVATTFVSLSILLTNAFIAFISFFMLEIKCLPGFSSVDEVGSNTAVSL